MSTAAPSAPVTLSVTVNRELTLNAGSCEMGRSTEGEDWLILPPRVSLFEQLIEYLWHKPDPLRLNRRELDIEALAVAALCLRWGSYLAVLLDQNKPLWALASDTSVSHIGQEEMQRINLEASTAFAQWMALYRQGVPSPDVRSLARRAVAHLPGIKSMGGAGTAPTDHLEPPSGTCRPITPERLLQAQEASSRAPLQVIANSLIDYAYCKGPVEQMHAGLQRGYPLDARRLTAPQESLVIRSVNGHLRKALRLWHRLAAQTPTRSREEQALPFALSAVNALPVGIPGPTNLAFHLASTVRFSEALSEIAPLPAPILRLDVSTAHEKPPKSIADRRGKWKLMLERKNAR